MRTNQWKAKAEEYEDKYDDEMVEDLENQLLDYLKDMTVDEVSSEDVEELVVNWKDALPEIGQWCFDQVQSEIDTINDQRYEEAKEERWTQ